MQTINIDKLKVKYLLLLAIIFFVLLVTRIYYDVHHHKHMINTKMDELHKSVLIHHKEITNNLQERYQSLSTHFMHVQNIDELLKNKDRKNLHSSLLYDYEKFRNHNPYLYVMHFFDTNNITILRMHKPASYGDDLTAIRPIVTKANKDKKTLFGFATGKNGITYRITTPFITKDGDHLGILEFGIKPQYFAKKLDNLLGVQTKIIVKTSTLKNLSYKTDFEKLGDFSILAKDTFFDNIKHKINLNKKQQVIEDGDKTYIVFNDLNLKNFNNDVVGKVIIAQDITKETNENRDSLLILNLINIFILSIALIVIYIVFTRYSESLKQAYENLLQLKKEVDTDELTNINNRTALNKYIQNTVTNENEYAIIFFDIDFFKNINDTYGHNVGDIILKQLTHLVSNTIRVDDFFARWGGEEFVIILKTRGIENAIKITRNIQEKINSYPYHNDLKVTCSFGVTMIDTPNDLESVMKRVDQLLYEAKNSGRNCIKSDN